MASPISPFDGIDLAANPITQVSPVPGPPLVCTIHLGSPQIDGGFSAFARNVTTTVVAAIATTPHATPRCRRSTAAAAVAHAIVAMNRRPRNETYETATARRTAKMRGDAARRTPTRGSLLRIGSTTRAVAESSTRRPSGP